MPPPPVQKKGRVSLREIRKAFTLYWKSEGCSCCGDHVEHKAAADVLGKILRFPKYKDGSGYDFSLLAPKPKKKK